MIGGSPSQDSYYLDEEDRQNFIDLVEELKRRRENSGRRYHHDDTVTAPEVYLIRTPPGGIPSANVGSGTGSGTGTSDDDIFGSAICTIWKLSEGGTGTGTADEDNVILDTDSEKRVYNITGTDIPAYTWCLASRDKYGVWWVIETGVGEDRGEWERGRWALVTSNSRDGYGYWPARLINKDSVGNRTLGKSIKVKLLPYAGDRFVAGVYWVTYLRTIDYDIDGSGTAVGSTGTATEEFDLYDGVGNDLVIEPVCRGSSIQYDRVYIYHPLRVIENGGSGTGEDN